jgi:hypothetical protein
MGKRAFRVCLELPKPSSAEDKCELETETGALGTRDAIVVSHNTCSAQPRTSLFSESQHSVVPAANEHTNNFEKLGSPCE